MPAQRPADEAAIDEEIDEDFDSGGDDFDAGGDDVDADGEDPGSPTAGPSAARPWSGPSAARWAVFALIAVAVVAADQATKSWIVHAVQRGSGFSVLGSWLNFVYGENSGILFGLVPQSASAFAIVSLVVIALIVVYHQKAGRGIVMTVATSLLLGGAIGNLVDRLMYGAVVDWIDMGIGPWRFWTYNIADAAITTSLLLILAAAWLPAVAAWGADD